jgi:hypothetical protein
VATVRLKEEWMTNAEFAALALSLPRAEASSHMGQADFRVANKIFATAGRGGNAVLKLTVEQQEMLLAAEPSAFERVPGSWGLKGWTHLVLAHADEATARGGLAMAWRNTAPKALLKANPGV